MQIKTKIVSGQTGDSKPVKQEANGTMILPPLVFPGLTLGLVLYDKFAEENSKMRFFQSKE